MAASGSSTCVIDPPIELHPILSHPTKPQDAKVPGLRLSDSKGIQDDTDSPTDLPSPTTHPVAKLEQWNHPRSNLFKTMAAFWSFVVMGSNDAAYGALIPYLQEYYHLTFVVISLVFLSPLVGYASSALLNNMIHLRFGQRGVAVVSTSPMPPCRIVSNLW